MTDNDITALIAEAREYVEFGNGLNWQGKIRELADALESRPLAADREGLRDWLHSRHEFEYDECDHGTYRGGAMDGQPYAMCERWADGLSRSGALRPVADVQAEALEAAATDFWAQSPQGPESEDWREWLTSRVAALRTPASPNSPTTNNEGAS